ncbi:HD domain-containing protein [Patescibacteria group bacterium]|nr:HD domain-containing protein [Patescibacteria group bacterium]MBU1028962.1 HD domain-containing protein [Patescibacteria group bacterium]
MSRYKSRDGQGQQLTSNWKNSRRIKQLEAQLKKCRGALANSAIKDEEARRRLNQEDTDIWINAYERPFLQDVNKARRSKMSRRLGNKTQVITVPLNSHTRDRQDHSLEAVADATDIASILSSNIELVQAGMLLHDCGHMPCGHAAEDFLSNRTGQKWRHDILGVVIAQQIERKGQGLNLTWQTLDIIRNHSRGSGAASVQGMRDEPAIAVKADKFAYTLGDFNDIFQREALAAQGFTRKRYAHIVEAAEWFGSCQREREFTCIANLCIESAACGYISFDQCEAAVRFEKLKRMMYEDVYTKIDRRVINMKMAIVYDALLRALANSDVDPALVFALMDDQELDWLFKKASRHEIIDETTLSVISVGEIIPHIRGRQIDVTEPDMDW